MKNKIAKTLLFTGFFVFLLISTTKEEGVFPEIRNDPSKGPIPEIEL